MRGSICHHAETGSCWKKQLGGDKSGGLAPLGESVAGPDVWTIGVAVELQNS